MQDDIVLGGNKNKFNWKIFSFSMMVLAILGLIFGVVMILVKNDEIAKVKAEYGMSGTGAGEDERGNPVIKAEPPAEYTIEESSSIFEVGENNVFLSLSVKDGAITKCDMEIEDANGNYTEDNCQIDGVDGKIYKIVKIDYSDTERINSALGLITTDGTVGYVPLSGVGGNTFNVKGKLAIDGSVIDAIGANVKSNEYLEDSSWSTIFVLRSGKILAFDAKMIEGM